MKSAIYRGKKIKCLLILGVLMLSLCTGCNEREASQLTYRQKGISLMENGKYEEALVEFQNALDMSLGDIGEEEIDICFYKAEAQYELGDVESAMKTYTSILEVEENAKAYFLRGNLYYSLGNEENALSDYAAAVEHAPKEYELYIGVYEALTAHGKDKEAQEYLNQALEIKGNSAYDKMQKGRIQFLLGESDTAIALLEEAIKGKETEGYFYLAEIQEALGNTQAAEENITAYIESGKVDSYNLFEVANSQLGKGNYAMAIQCLNQALALETVPNKQMILKTLIIAHEQNRDFGTAKELMAEYIEAYPDDEEAMREYTFLETR